MHSYIRVPTLISIANSRVFKGFFIDFSRVFKGFSMGISRDFLVLPEQLHWHSPGGEIRYSYISWKFLKHFFPKFLPVFMPSFGSFLLLHSHKICHFIVFILTIFCLLTTTYKDILFKYRIYYMVSMLKKSVNKFPFFNDLH